MSLLRKLHRIRKMPAAEIVSRCHDRLRLVQDRVSMKFPSPPQSIDFALVGDRCTSLVPGMDSAELEKLRGDFPGSHEAIADPILAAAGKIMEGKIELLGRSVDVLDPDWHKDPLSDFRWPEDFFADVQIYELPADVKYVWELSRHQFFPALSQAWLISGDDRYASRVQDLVGSWIDSNPLYRGVNWTSALEVAIRAMSWIWSIAGMRSWTGWKRQTTDRIIASLADHATFLFHHLSYYSSPYNHLVGEASALYMLSFVLADHSHAGRWRSRALQVLGSDGPKQFYEDGFTVEQATGYHFFTLGFLIQAIIAGRKFGDSLSELEALLNQASQAGALLRRPNGRWPCVGDLDSARSIPTVHRDFWDFRGICALAASTFRNEELGASFGDHDAETFWLLGTSSVQWLRGLSADQLPAAGILPTAGYACWSNSQDDWVMLDCGPVGDGVHSDNTPSVAHGHDDALSLHLVLSGQDILQDSGMLRYAGSRDWVDYLRSEDAHNRIVIEGVAGMQNAGRLAWSDVQQQTTLTAKLAEEVALMRAALTLSDGISIERHLMMRNECGLWLIDFVRLDRPRKVDWRWHFPAAASLSQKSNQTIQGASFQLRSWCSEEFTSTITQAQEDSPHGWHAPGYGVQLEGFLVRQQVASSSPTLIMATHFGDPAAHLRLTAGTTEIDLSPDVSSPLPLPTDLQSVVWQLVSPVEEAYRVGADIGDGVRDSMEGEGQLPVHRLPPVPS